MKDLTARGLVVLVSLTLAFVTVLLALRMVDFDSRLDRLERAPVTVSP